MFLMDQDKKNLHDALGGYLKEVEIEGYDCSSCSRSTKATKSLLIKSFPTVLLLTP